MTETMTNENANGKEQPPQKNRKHRKRIIIPAILLLVVAAAVFFYWYNYLRGYVSTDDAMIDSDAMTISSKISGRITALGADEGDSVMAGDLLVSIDDSDLNARAAQARADLAFIRGNVQVARIALDQATDDFYRDSVQFSNNVITRQQYDHAAKALEMARAQQSLALSHVNASQAQLGVIETELANTRIFAAAPGVVARKWVVPSDVVQAGQPIFTLFDLDDVWVTANFEETKLASIHPGDSVEISVDAYSGRKFTGRVELIGAAAASQFSLIPPNNASGNFTKVTQRVPIKIVFTNLDRNGRDNRVTLLPGMSVAVKIRVGEM